MRPLKWLALGMLFTASVCSADQSLYVATDGNDGWSGRSAAPTSGHTDGPLLTLQRARDAARKLHETAAGETVTIWLAGGEYVLHDPLRLGPQDSRTTWSALPGQKPLLSGGRLVEHWTSRTLNGREVWETTLPQDTPAFRELWVDGHRRTRARLPKQGVYEVAGLLPADQKTDWNRPVEAVVCTPPDIHFSSDVTEGEAILCTKWVESHLPLAGIDAGANTLRFSCKTQFQPELGDPYWIENLPECLTLPGEWRLAQKTLQYLPLPGEKLGTVRAVTPFLPSLVEIDGDAKTGNFAEKIKFSGVTFANSEWWFDHQPDLGGHVPETSSGFSQASVGVGGVVIARGAHHCEIDDCDIEHAGNYGIDFGQGCVDNVIARCQLIDLGGGGVKIGAEDLPVNPGLDSFGNIVTDCTIADDGRLFPSAVGIWIGQSHDNQLLYNDIHGLWYSGISIGWRWGYAKANSGGNIVAHNEVHHIGLPADGIAPLLSDMGAIYTLGAQPRSVIRLNRFHDIAGRVYGGWGIYFDEGTSDVVAEGNIVYRTTHGGFHQHYGQRNLISNNIFAYGRDAQIQRTRIEDHPSFTFTKNLVCWTDGNLFSGNWSKINATFDHNLYWTDHPDRLRLAQWNWQQWQAAGEDAHSAVATPGFTDPADADFRLLKNVKLVADGFAPIEQNQVGPRQSLRGK
jgi:hypothetical protein